MVRPYTVGKPFRFWCQKILPLVYDDSLSYYELLNKVVDYLNKVINNVDSIGEAFNDLGERFESLQSSFNELSEMVDNYFDNLDVQQEINNKLDEMAEDGTLDALIQPLVDSSVSDAVSEWLEENVNPTGSAVVVDASLTVSGAAADAKVTGDEISDLKSDFSAVADIVPSPNLLDVDAVTNGYLRNTGVITASGDWVTTDFIPVEYGKTYTYSITANSARQTGSIYFRLEYDENKTIIANSYVETGTSRITPSENAKYVRFSYHNIVTVTERCFAEGNEIVYYEFGKPSSVTVKDESNSESVKRIIGAVEVTQSENLFNKETAKSGYIRNMSGDITASTDWFYSDYITVEYGKTYVLFSATTKQALYFLQEVNASKSGINYVYNASTPYTPSSEDVKYIRFCQKPITLDSLVFKEGNQATMIYTAYGNVLVSPYRSSLYGKKWVAVGDSLTEKNVSAVSNYTDFISTINRMNLINMGVGGTGYMRGYDANNAFYQRVANIPDCDIITLFGSGNDLAYYSDLGTATDTTTDTICGCINETLDVIFANHPTTPLLVIAPTPWAGNTPDMTTGMALYCERLKEICSMRGVAYLDLFHHSGLRPNDTVQRDLVFYSGSLDGHGDYVHPNKLGHSIIAPRIMQAMESIALA